MHELYQLVLTGREGGAAYAGTLPVDADGFAYLVYRADRTGPAFTHVDVQLGSQVVLVWDGTS